MLSAVRMIVKPESESVTASTEAPQVQELLVRVKNSLLEYVASQKFKPSAVFLNF